GYKGYSDACVTSVDRALICFQGTGKLTVFRRESLIPDFESVIPEFQASEENPLAQMCRIAVDMEGRLQVWTTSSVSKWGKIL
ncbi:hypothetical protein NL533_34340, partial [Klebsiella pneumoniae]|nr:hypothetical protein [Klebsiella pneumoniae]